MYFKLFKPQERRKKIRRKREDAIVRCCHSLLFCYRMMKACGKRKSHCVFVYSLIN